MSRLLTLQRFFANLAPLSPVLSDFYSYHSNHYYLVTQDSLLCCAVLMISSQYHILEGIGGATRASFLHQKLWDYCQQLIMRLTLGQEKRSKAKTRTLGSIEALLLLTEWQSRALLFPPTVDGWDSDFLVTTTISKDPPVQATKSSASTRWLEDVVEPVHRSDAMSWMLIGMAFSLGHELDLFSPAKTGTAENSRSDDVFSKEQALTRSRLVKLLYVFADQYSARLGYTSMVCPSLSHAVALKSPSTNLDKDPWNSFMMAWIELTRLAKSVSDMLYAGEDNTQRLLKSGRYVSLLQHIQGLLSQWHQKFLASNGKPHPPAPSCAFH